METGPLTGGVSPDNILQEVQEHFTPHSVDGEISQAFIDTLLPTAAGHNFHATIVMPEADCLETGSECAVYGASRRLAPEVHSEDHHTEDAIKGGAATQHLTVAADT